MKNNRILRIVANTLGLEMLVPGRVPSRFGETITVDWFWIADIVFFDTTKHLILSYIKGDVWKKGVLFIPTSDSEEAEEEQKYLGMKIPYAVELNEWSDPVSDLLHNIDLLPNPLEQGRGSGIRFDYTLTVYGWKSYATFSYMGWPTGDEGFLKLWLATVENVHRIIKKYNVDEITNFIYESHNYKVILGEIGSRR